MPQDVHNLETLLDRLGEAAEARPRLTFSEMLGTVGRRSFGPILLFAGLIILAPLLGDIPGVPTTMAVFLLLTIGQLLVGREHIWLPRWMLSRSVPRAKIRKVLGWARKPARFVDRLTRRRLQFLVRPPATSGTASVGLLVALGLPFMEVIPFSANAAGLILVLLGLALIAHDGLLALMAMVMTALTVMIMVMIVT